MTPAICGGAAHPELDVQVDWHLNVHMGHPLPYAANCSLFTEVELLKRPAAARAAGFDAIELWWPWPDQPVPPDAEIDRFVAAVREAGVQLIGLNFAGDVAGLIVVLSIPARSEEFRDNIAVTTGIGEALGVPAFNALYGNRVSDVTPQQQDELAAENLTLAAKAVAAIRGTILVEPVSGPKPYPLRTARDVAAVLDRVAAPNIGFLCDLFHLANNGDDIDATWGLRRPDRPCPDRRSSRTRRTRHRHPRPRALPHHH